jgi:tetratricopeptide (TPR) repeat protein
VRAPFRRTLRDTLRATAVLAIASLAFAPVRASAARSLGASAPQSFGASDEEGLDPDAIVHLRRGAEHYKRGDYARAELEFGRVARLAPDWQPIRYNLAIAAEAQGKLDLAISHYQAYLADASEREQQVLTMRVTDLERRRSRIVALHRRRIVTNSALLLSAAGLMAGGAAMLAIGVQRQDDFAQEPSYGLILGGALIASVGVVPLSFGLIRIRNDRRRMRTMRSIAWAPVAGPRSVGATLTGRF